MSARTDVVVVGAGVMGCGVAYWLTREGHRVTVVEKEALASGASGVAAAMLSSPTLGDPLGELNRASLGLYAELVHTLPEETGVDIGYLTNPHLRVALSDEDAAGLRQEWSGWSEADRPRWVVDGELREVEPQLTVEAVAGLLSDQSQVLAYRFVLALARAAESHGAQIRHGEATGVERTGPRATGVRLKGGEVIPAGQVVLACGPWTGNAESWTGWKMPVYPVRGQLLELREAGPPLRTSVSHGGMYLVHKADGVTLAGATEEHASGFENRTTPEGRAAIMEAAVRLVPGLERAELVNHVSGLRPCSADGLPLIGRLPDWDNLYVVAGHFRRGMQLGPMSARIIADLVTSGRTGFPIEKFDPARFGRA